jgi:hypothetical protein
MRIWVGLLIATALVAARVGWALLTRRRQRRREERALATERDSPNTWECPKCRHANLHSKGSECMMCGYNLATGKDRFGN